MKSRKNNQSYKFGCSRNEAKMVFRNSNKTDRGYMIDQMKNHFNYLDRHGIFEYQNFIQILRDHQFMANDILNLLESFVFFKNQQNLSQPFFLLKPREMKKTNAGEKNILFNRLAHEYSSEFLYFFELYLNRFYPGMKTKENLIQKFKTKIDQLTRINEEPKKEFIDLNTSDNSVNLLNSIPADNEITTDDGFFLLSNEEPSDNFYVFPEDEPIIFSLE
ncbi:hypothetical protein M9Y10_000885 [Tritrichomonas musculus]|uniref:Uncharacterized protein n=1 Tax=Tritrichomonas musculus TaxID=1915356 RepID=A0ABR2L6A4_9EUKA